MTGQGSLFGESELEPLRKVDATNDETRKVKRAWKPKAGVRWERCKAQRRTQCQPCVLIAAERWNAGITTLTRSIRGAAYVRTLTTIRLVEDWDSLVPWPPREVHDTERSYLCIEHAQDQLDADRKDRIRVEFEQGLHDFGPRRR